FRDFVELMKSVKYRA
ncbi:hypothetical protein CISIN_1g0475441mg, partial [Citrus sinensis]